MFSRAIFGFSRCTWPKIARRRKFLKNMRFLAGCLAAAGYVANGFSKIVNFVLIHYYVVVREVQKIKILSNFCYLRLPAYLLFLRSNNSQKHLKLQLDLETLAPATPIFFANF